MKKKKIDDVLATEDTTSLTNVTYEDMDNLEEEFQEAIKTDPKYSLQVA